MKANLQIANNAIEALVEDIKRVTRENEGLLSAQTILAIAESIDQYI